MYKQFFWKYNAEFIKSVIQDAIDSEDLNITCNMFCYHNDVCPSLLLESESQTYTLFLPNSWQNDGEETTKFTLIYDEDYAYRQKECKVLDTVQDVINLLITKRNQDLIK